MPSKWYDVEKEKLWKLIFGYLSRRVLALVCAPVSKDWHKWINELSDVWHEIDLNGKQNMSSLEWKSVADKRPKLLNLGSSQFLLQ